MDAARNKTWKQAIHQLTRWLDEGSINYTLKGAAALVVLDCDIQPLEKLMCAFQWDQVKEVQQLFSSHVDAGPLNKTDEGASMEGRIGEVSIHLFCEWNTVIVTDPTRISHDFEGRSVHVEAPSAVLSSRLSSDAVKLAAASFLSELQTKNTAQSRAAWNTGTYEAWMNRFGEPKELGLELKLHPDRKLAPILDYIGEVNGKIVLNLMGSNGIKGVAMASKGAVVTVIDLSAESARYAQELAATAGVPLQFLVGDVLNDTEISLTKGAADLILMERGILHYFVNLEPLFARISFWLKKGGRFVLQDFHPVSTKLIQSKGKKHQVSGNYFDPAIYPTPVAISKYTENSEASYVYQRRWTIAEIVTAVAEAGLRITRLDESPNEKRQDIGIPKMFTLTAEK